MTSARETYTLTVLPDGTVLAVGGFGLTSAETYDPSTGVWTPTSNTPNASYWSSTATLLPDGKVLIAGGHDSNTSTAIYDPTTRTFSNGPSMSTMRELPAAVRLQDGRVLITGGDNFVTTFTSAEIYNPTTDAFSPAADMHVPRISPGGTLLPNGKVLIAGGYGSPGITATAEIYDPSTNTWTLTGSMHEARTGGRNGMSMYLLPNGHVLADVSFNTTPTSEEYDPASGVWQTPVNLIQTQIDGADALLHDGRMLLVSGSSGSFVTAAAEIYTLNAVTPTSTPTPTPTPIPNQSPVVNPLSNATINEADTYSYSGSFTDPDSTSWTATVDYGDGSGIQPLHLNSDKTFNLSHVYKDEGSYTVTVAVADNQGASSAVNATITVKNAPLTVNPISVSQSVLQVNTQISATATFTDPGALDTHPTAVWDWGDGTTTVTPDDSTKTVSGTHTYAAAGVYSINIIVTDDDGLNESPTSPFQYVSVYNPTSQGIFSAGSKYTSPAGAYAQNTSLTGDVKFGLSYKYQGTMPVGDKQFTMNFKAANLTFNATTVSSLVISNGVGTLTGTGTINNGSIAYNFLVTGSEANNTIRIQITDPSNNNNVIYDTQPGQGSTAVPITSVSGHVLAH